MKRASRSTVASIVVLVLAAAAPLRADHDEIESPWGTVHGNVSGTASSAVLPYTLGEGPMEEKWRIDIDAEGQDIPRGRASITFDKDGNLYWISSSTLIPGIVRLLSASPAGTIRWFGNVDGTLHQLGTTFSGASPVVGQARVYGTGDIAGSLYVVAYDKATGQRLWETDLTPSLAPNNQTLTPVLRDGKLFVVGVNGGASTDFHRLDAETGTVEWSSNVSDVKIPAVGQMTFVPNAFDTGIHGLYFNGTSNNGADGIPEVYGIKIEDGGASFGWSSEGGHVARSHVIYSKTNNHLYTLTWTDFDYQLYVFDLVDNPTGPLFTYVSDPASGHGYYDVGCLDFDDTIIGGGFDGKIFRYTDTGDAISPEIIYRGGFVDTPYSVPFWGETRVIGQLLKDPDGNSILISGTNSLQCCASHIFALDVTSIPPRLLWEHDTGIRNDHTFIYAGGPIMGPDGKIYYMERLPDTTQSALVAVGPAAAQPKPSAGFLVIGPENTTVGMGTDPCINAGEKILLDGSCSIGKDLVFRYSVDPPTAATFTHPDETSPIANVVFKAAGQIKVTLQVEDAGGIGEWSQELCVTGVPPHCSFKVLTESGGQIDSADDDVDNIPCLPVGEKAVADASLSSGGDLEFEYTVTPLNGVFIDGDTLNPVANIIFNETGVFKIALKVKNSMGEVPCVPKNVCVKELTAPVNLRVTDQKEKVALAWDKVADATLKGYNLFRADVAEGPFQKLDAAVLDKDADQYVDTAVTVGEDYFYRLRSAYAASQESADSNTATAVVERSQTEPLFRRGDVDANGVVELTDVINTLGYLFLGTPTNLGCFDAADVDDTGVVELTDAVVSLGWQFRGDPTALSDPGPFTCGPDKDASDTLPACETTCQ